ncbi:MAG: hypothetical protein IKQ70_13590 [Bacteroidales bacterium]|nr:hypothetical protein [Bacteroidales bacterium]MBP5369683.1 hypothetical protein [Bacteroidales bacterium]MBP5504254.1 hypothetical protein [Bacteroidales bacterium]MBR6178891.1 hypothetical protein [Bacteroidales bacterium]MDD6002497.1 hypothetical protein [Bacteroidales bacterium]
MKSIKLLAIILSVLMFQSCIITQEYTIHNDMSGSQYTEIDYSAVGAILGETADSLTHQVDSIFNEAFTGNASKEGLSNYKYGNKDGKYFISFDFANAENTEIGVQFSKNGNKISVNFDKMKELFDSMNEKESVDNSGMDMSAMFQYTAIFNFDKKVASVTGVDAEITGKKTVKVPIKINSFPKGDVIITLK